MEPIPLSVAKPARYSGIEAHATRKDPATTGLRFALCYPDIYEIGMSYYGLFLLYELANNMDGVWCERCFMPWTDMEAHLREKGLPLATLESRTPLGAMDVVGFSLTYELNVTNVLAMLEMGGIPLRSEERRGLPIVIGGGPLMLNPRPVERFFDAIVVGEADTVLPELLRAVRETKGYGRQQVLEVLSGIEGVYVPLLPREAVRRLYVPDLDGAYHPVRPPMPVVGSIHDRLTVEVSRGCGNGCRFCLAGFGYRPYRERSLDAVKGIIDRALSETGYGEVSFLSLTAGEYGPLLDAITYVRDAHPGVALSLPSLKIGTITEAEIGTIGGIARTGFTFALEAGTEDLRCRINKNIDAQTLVGQIPVLKEFGWRKVKLYLMTGFPWEEEGDVDQLASLIRLFSRASMDVNISISPFIPKPHTPFQWLPMEDPGRLRERMGVMKRMLQGKRVRVTYRDVETSMTEALVARGDERLGDLFEGLHREGVRLEAWREHFRPDIYGRLFDRLGIDPARYLGPRPVDGPLPWDLVVGGVDKAFLAGELQRAGDSVRTGDCYSGCEGCGMGCEGGVVPGRRDFGPQESLSIRSGPLSTAGPPSHGGPQPPAISTRITFRYAKYGEGRLIGHLDASNILVRALRASDLRILMHGRFHPLPKISLSPAIPVGVESFCEFIEAELEGVIAADRSLIQTINGHLPRGLKIMECFSGAIRDVAMDTAYVLISGGSERPEGLLLLQFPRSRQSFWYFRGEKVRQFLEGGTFTRIIKTGDGKVRRWLQS